jgi:hypothetical protein
MDGLIRQAESRRHQDGIKTESAERPSQPGSRQDDGAAGYSTLPVRARVWTIIHAEKRIQSTLASSAMLHAAMLSNAASPATPT